METKTKVQNVSYFDLLLTVSQNLKESSVWVIILDLKYEQTSC